MEIIGQFGSNTNRGKTAGVTMTMKDNVNLDIPALQLVLQLVLHILIFKNNWSDSDRQLLAYYHLLVNMKSLYIYQYEKSIYLST